MNEPKFTPGPWSFIQENHIQYALLRAEDKRICIFKSRPEEYDANLIAAAPDLYEALDNLENDDGSIPDHAWKLVQAALAKARGEG